MSASSISSTRRTRAASSWVRRFGRIAWDANITGLSSMLAYNILLGIVPLALLGLFVAGHVLASPAVMHTVTVDLRAIFPGTTKEQLNSLLQKISGSTTSTGVFGLIAALWLASSFWGALDTSFGRIFNCPTRPWLKQKRFGIVMVGVVVLFMLATVSIPTAQSLLKAGATQLPFSLRHVDDLIYAASIAFSLALLFGCLALIYSRVPNRPMPWHGVWPGALGATVLIGAIDYAFPIYLSSISTIARFGTTIVFIVIVLGWFYALALIILAGAVLNAVSLQRRATR